MKSKTEIYKIMESDFLTTRELERLNNVSLYQGKGFVPYLFYLLKNTQRLSESIVKKINAMLDDPGFQEIIMGHRAGTLEEEIGSLLDKETLTRIDDIKFNCYEDSLKNLNWESFWENECEYTSRFIGVPPEIYLFDILYSIYKAENEERYPVPSQQSPLEKYYLTKGIELNLKDNYGLIQVRNGWQLKWFQTPKIYDPVNDTHILIRMVSRPMMELLNSCFIQPNYHIKLSLRPDYEICGDGIRDIRPLFEWVERGSIYEGRLAELPKLTSIFNGNYDKLLISHNPKEKEVTIEELREDLAYDNGEIVTQVVHLMYEVEKDGNEYIHHLDHEYIFYSEDEYTEKMMEHLTKHGEVRSKYKTFKIDGAKIPMQVQSADNILYKTLCINFKQISLIEEFFSDIITKTK